MRLRLNRAALLFSVMAAVVLGLVFVLIPSITAQSSFSQVGNIDAGNRYRCLMFNPRAENPDDPVTLEATSAPHIVESNNDEWPDMNALMRCEAQIDGYDGPVYHLSGNTDYNSTVNCVVALAPWEQELKDQGIRYTTNWNQTISSSGNVDLVCRFKK